MHTKKASGSPFKDRRPPCQMGGFACRSVDIRPPSAIAFTSAPASINICATFNQSIRGDLLSSSKVQRGSAILR